MTDVGRRWGLLRGGFVESLLLTVTAAMLVLAFSLACRRGRGVVRWRRVILLVTTPLTVVA